MHKHIHARERDFKPALGDTRFRTQLHPIGRATTALRITMIDDAVYTARKGGPATTVAGRVMWYRGLCVSSPITAPRVALSFRFWSSHAARR